MANNSGTAIWEGGLKEGMGNVSTQSSALRGSYNVASRFGEDNTGTNPEEILGAAHAACYSMFLASLLEKAGHPPIEIETKVVVMLSRDDTGPFIKELEVITKGNVPDITEQQFLEFAEKAKRDCPVSRSLQAVPEMKLIASLVV